MRLSGHQQVNRRKTSMLTDAALRDDEAAGISANC
jgi:hypothetical protein